MYAAIAKQWYISAWFVNQTWLAKNREAALVFARTITRAQAWANSHQAETAKTLQAVAKLTDDNIARMVRVPYGTTFDPRLLQPVLDASARVGITKATITAREMMADL